MRTARRTPWTYRIIVAAIAVGGLVAVGCSDDGAGQRVLTPPQADLPPGDAPPLDRALTTELASVIDSTVHQLGAPGAAVVVTTPEGRWETTTGVSDVEAGSALQAGLRWPLRSVTKSYTTTLILQLVDEGKLSLDDPVSNWLGGVPNGDRVTVRQLGDMTSGLPDYTNEAFISDFVADPTREFTIDELIAYATALPAVAEPGSEAVYTNTNTLLLGRIVEEVTGEAFDDVLRDRILEPLGLPDSVYPTGSDQWTEDSTGYAPEDDGTLGEQPVNFSVFGPAGAMIATTDDLVRWGRALATGELLDPGTHRQRLQGAELEVGPEYDRYAFGIGELEGWWGHTGEGFGYTALVMHDERTGTTVGITMNASQLDSHGPTTLFRRLAPLLTSR